MQSFWNAYCLAWAQLNLRTCFTPEISIWRRKLLAHTMVQPQHQLLHQHLDAPHNILYAETGDADVLPQAIFVYFDVGSLVSPMGWGGGCLASRLCLLFNIGPARLCLTDDMASRPTHRQILYELRHHRPKHSGALLKPANQSKPVRFLAARTQKTTDCKTYA